MALTRTLTILVAVLALGPFLGTGAGFAAASAAPFVGLHLPHAAPNFATTAGSPFLFVSNFENRTLGNWSATSGTASVGISPNYLGEPALISSAKAGTAQVDQASSGITPGASSVSFQVEINYARGGTGFFGLTGPHGFLAAVGVEHGSTVWAGASAATAVNLGAIPTGTAQPAGWVELLAVISNTPTSNGSAWEMQVYVDRTDVVAGANISVPHAGTYTGAEIRTLAATVDYTDIFVSTYQIPTTIPGYNNMDGYGQGSDLLVGLLPQYTTLEAQMVLRNWSTPQVGILGTQINAMNRAGTTRNTCTGFYQLGVDLDPNGHIAPWYVSNNNCVGIYFATHTPRVNSGFYTPPGTRLTLKITDNVRADLLNFSIIDHSITGPNATSQVSIPYNGTAFEASYTQLEWQPCCSSHPISSYFFNGSIYDMTISGRNVTGSMPLPATYMVPFALDVPPSWDYGYYNSGIAGYDQVG
jgi:hypothetical protein